MENIRHFEELFRREYPRFCQSAFRITQDMAVAEDLVQDAFLNYWHHEQRASIRVPEAYLYQAVVNKALNAVISQKRRVEQHAHYGRQQGVAANFVEQSVQLRELEEQLQRALESLPPM